ncbi:MAG TPA: exodeoxyribonuclease VII small subunit [Candidatus Cloacimonadota bacterium]|nr:exodeoxyribonuclease VII small subunit [Candidatus Cloacimonadota bacterium]
MKEKIKFEDALKRLEEIISQLENGEKEIDEIVKLFEEGSELAASCNLKLEQVENKIETLTQKLHQLDN